jgi:hypothetical protein
MATRTNEARLAGVLGGGAYVAASVAFMAVFAWLNARFAYPDVLDQPAADVLPALLALGGAGRAVWVLYALIPLMLIPAAVGTARALRRDAGGGSAALNLAVMLQVVAALAMTLGLARWSTAQWTIAQAWPVAGAVQRESLTVLFDALNSYLGNAIGEFVGELALYGSFAAFAVVLMQAKRRALGVFAWVTAVLGLVGMFRNVTYVVQPAADVTNVLLPVFLIVFGASIAFRPAGREV